MPSIFVDFANDCRVDSGYRLLERCLRHGFDNKADPLLNKKGCFIIKEDSTIGIVLNNTMPASMRNNTYNVEVCVTKDELTAC